MGFKKIFALTVVLLLGVSGIFVFGEEDQKNDSSDGFTSVMPSGTDINLFWQFDTSTGKGPFGCFYGAVNRYDGANNDDSTEARLSTEKGAIGYILNPNDWTRTLSGNTFTNSLYNTMLIIPPVYWYSELDSEGGSTGKLYMANTPDAFPGKTLVDYAHTYTSGGVVGHAPAIGIGVYKGMTLHNSVTDLDEITSVRLGEPTTNVSLADWVTYSNNASVGNDNGTYQVCNFYQWTLYKLMCHTILGNMDSQYMMGPGLVYNENLSEHGTYLYSKGVLSSPYVKSTITTTDYARASPVSLLIENPWGGMTEYIGDMTVDGSGNLSIGNTLGGVTDSSLVQNALTITVPANVSISGYGSDGYIDTFNSSSEVFGLPSSLRNLSSPTYPGNAINDTARVNASTGSVPSCTFVVSGGFTTTQSQISEFGLSSCHTTNLDWSDGYPSVGARLGYVFEDDSSITSEPFAYIMDYNTNGTISDIRVNAQGKHIVQIEVNNPTYGSVSSSLISVDDNSVISVMDNEITIGTTTITATPSSDTPQYHYEFDTWSGIPGSWEVIENMVITANFTRYVREYDVSFSAVGPGQVSETSITVPYGTVVSEHGNELTIDNNVIVATPMPSQMGYTATLDYWNYPLTITGDCTIYAIFSETLNSYTITINVNNSAYGSVSESTVTANYGDTIYGTTVSPQEGTLNIGSMSVTALANPTAEYIYEFVEWDNIPSGGMVDDDYTITAIFSATVNYISVDIFTNNSNYGTVSPSSISVPYGSQISTNQNILTVGNVTVTATPSAPTTGHTYEFNFWDYSSSEITYPTSITAYFSEVLEQCTIEFVSNNTEYGSVSQSTLVVSYGTTITVNGNEITFDDYGITTTVYATPSSESLPHRYTFSGWSNVPTGNVVLTDTTISANFTHELVTYDVTIQVLPDDSYGTVSETTLTVTALSSISVSDNTITIESSTVTAIPHARTPQYTYAFDYWDYQEKSYVDADMTITANFIRTLNMYTITIQSNNTEYGNVSDTVISAGYGTVIRANGSTLQIGSQTVTATPEPQSQQYVYAFNNWTRNNQQISVVNVTGDMTIVANFIHALRQYTVSFTIDESGWGSVSPTSVTVPYGTEINPVDNVLTIGSTSVTASPSATTEQYVYSFDTWLNIPSDRLVTDHTTITAKFIRSDVDYEITITAGPGGSISPDRLIVPYGTSISANGNILSVGSATVTATPDNATAQYTYTFGAWGGVPVSGIITAHTPITASFVTTVNEYTVTISVNESTWGTVSDASVTVPYGTVITTNGTTLSIGSNSVTASPTEDTAQYDYGFRIWLSDYQPVHNTSVNGNMEIVANFYRELKQYTVSVAVNEDGWGTVSPTSVTVPYGTAINPVGSTLEIGNNSVTATPSQSDAQYVYDFGTWGDVPASRVVNGNMTITAVFTRSDVDYEVLIIAGEGGTVSRDRMVVPYGTTISAVGNVLSIGVADITATPNDANVQYTYTFSSWSGIPDGGIVTQNVSVNAIFDATLNQYTVTIRANNDSYGSVSESSITVDYGTSISTSGQTLDIGGHTVTATPNEATAQYTYGFSNWSYLGNTVDGNKTVTAVFSRTVNQYTVFINVNDGSWGSVTNNSVTVDYGTSVSVTGNTLDIGSESIVANPSPTTDQYVYSFAEWLNVPSEINGNVTITAVFSRSDVMYEVSISTDGFGTVSVNRFVVPYGTSVSASGSVLTVGSDTSVATPDDATAQYTYSFSAWNNIPASGIVTDHVSIVAVFSATLNQYTVTISVNENGWGTVSQSSVTVDYGTSISSSLNILHIGSVDISATSTESDAQYTYTFGSWQYLESTVTDNMTAIAVFNRTVNQYTVSIVANDITWGSVSRGAVTVDYGTSISSDGNVLEIGSESVTATPSQSTAQYSFSFVGWVDIPASGTVTESVIVTAQFMNHLNEYVVTINAGTGGSVSESRLVVPYGTSVTSDNNRLSVGATEVVATPDDATAQYTYTFREWVNIPIGNEVTESITITAEFDATLNNYTVSVTVNNSEYGSVSPDSVTVPYGTSIIRNGNTLEIGSNSIVARPSDNTAQYTYSLSSWNGPSRVTGNTEITAQFIRTVNQYTVTIVSDNDEYGSVSRSSVTVNYGTTVTTTENTMYIGSVSVTANPSPATSEFVYIFSEWSNVPSSVTENTTITALFTRVTNAFTVTVSVSGNGTVSDSEIVVPYGTSIFPQSNELMVGSQIVTATPNDSNAQYTHYFSTWDNLPSSGEVTENIEVTAVFTSIVNQYVVTFYAGNGGSVSDPSVTVDYGTSVVTNGAKITLGDFTITATPNEPDAQYTYTFGYWSAPSTITDTTTINAYFTATVNQYTVTFVSANPSYGTVSVPSITAGYGAIIQSHENVVEIGPYSATAVPNDATAQYTYYFTEWVGIEGNTTLIADMTITAVFSRIVNDFTITIVTEGNGNVSTNIVNAEYGASITAESNVLTIGVFEVVATPGERTQQYTYYFDSWEGIDGIDSVTEDMEITAQFGYTVNRYTLYISPNDAIYGNVSQPSITVDYGTPVSIDNNTLVIGETLITASPSQSTVQYTYDFVRWDNIPSEITMDSVGHAIFSRDIVNYTVYFNVNESEYGNVFPESVTVPYGTSITSSGNTVTVGSTTVTATPSGIIEGYSHAFSKWTGIPNDNAVVSNITVTAVFSRTLITVTVTIHATDYGTVSTESMEVDYGTGIRYEENILYVGEQTVIATPYTSDAQYTYRFDGWMGISADTITDDMDITAQFSRTVNQYTVTIGVNSDYGTVSPTSVTVDYGTDIIVNGQNMTIGSTVVTATPYEDTSEYSYAFDRWVMESARVTNDMSVTAVFSRTIETYIIHITVVNPDYGTVSKNTIEADYGTSMRIDGNRLIIGSQDVVATPVASTEVYEYTFGGWSSIGDKVESDMDVTATFHRDLTAWAFSIVAIEEGKDTDSGELFKTVLKIIPILVLGVLIYIGASRFIRSNGDSDYDSDDDYY